MGQLICRNLFDEQEQNAGEYFKKALAAAARAGALTERRQDEMQAQLWTLLARQTARYTAGDSSSVPIETAQRLLASVYHTLGLALKNAQSEAEKLHLLRKSSIKMMFEAGQQCTDKRVQQVRRRLREVQSIGLPAPNLAYRDTVFAALPAFLKQYDRLFFAQEIPCMLDYPLCLPVPDALEGAEYIHAYLLRLRAENAFFLHFAPETCSALLCAVSPDPVGLLLNLFEPVLQNALALALLGAPPDDLCVTPAQRQALGARLRGASVRTVSLRLTSAADALARQYALEGAAGYLRTAAQALAPRLTRQVEIGDLNAMFPSF